MSLIIKATFKTETRRFRLETAAEATYANLAQTLYAMFGDKQQLKFSYTDSDGDVIAFSSENEFRDAVAQRATEADPLKILVISTKDVENNNNNKIEKEQQPANVWLELPVWVRRRVMARNNLVGDINDAALFDQLPLDARERIHAKFSKFSKKQQFDAANAAAAAPAPAPAVMLSQPIVIVDGTKNAVPDAASSTTPVDTEELSAEQVWASMPSWFKNRVVSKFVPHLLPQAEDYAAFVALPEHVKFRVRARAAQFNAKRDNKDWKADKKEWKADWRDEKKHHHCGGRFGGGQKFFGAGPHLPPQDGAVEPHPPMHPPMHQPQHPIAPMYHPRAMMFARGGAPHAAPTAESVEFDRFMWNSLPEWVHFKIASKAAHHGMQVSDPHDFAVFQALPVHVQAKVRAKGQRGKFQKCAKQ